MSGLVRDRFACSWEKKGTLTVLSDGAGETATQGGDVVSYVCTPDGRVLHAIPAAPSPEVYLAELRWALELWDSTRSAAPGEAALRVQRAHAAAPRNVMRALLAASPLPDVGAIERQVFEKVLGVPYDPHGSLVLQEVPTLLFVNRFR